MGVVKKNKKLFGLSSKLDRKGELVTALILTGVMILSAVAIIQVTKKITNPIPTSSDAKSFSTFSSGDCPRSNCRVKLIDDPVDLSITPTPSKPQKLVVKPVGGNISIEGRICLTGTLTSGSEKGVVVLSKGPYTSQTSLMRSDIPNIFYPQSYPTCGKFSQYLINTKISYNLPFDTEFCQKDLYLSYFSTGGGGGGTSRELDFAVIKLSDYGISNCPSSTPSLTPTITPTKTKIGRAHV